MGHLAVALVRVNVLRMMEEMHLAYRGDDNFVKHWGDAFGLGFGPEIRAFVQRRCSVHWIQIPDLRKTLCSGASRHSLCSRCFNPGMM